MTDVEGRFALDLPAAAGWLFVKADRYGEALLEVAPPFAPVEIRLARTVETSGRIRTTRGEPLAYKLLALGPRGVTPDDAGVARARARRTGTTRILSTEEIPTALAVTVTDPEGRFDFRSAAPGRYDLFAWVVVGGLYRPTLAASGLEAGRGGYEIAVDPPRPGVVTLVPQAAEDGSVLEKARVHLYDERGEMAGAGSVDEGVLGAKTWMFGRITVEVTAEGRLATVRSVLVEAGRTVELGSVPLARGGGRLRVVPRGWEAYRHCRVRGRDPATGLPIRAARDGEAFELACAPGSVNLTVECLGEGDDPVRTVTWTARVVGGETREVTIDLELSEENP